MNRSMVRKNVSIIALMILISPAFVALCFADETKSTTGIAAPPRAWKSVFKQKYTGRGMGKGNHVLTAKAHSDFVVDDVVVVTGKNCEVWDDKWKKCIGQPLEMKIYRISGQGSIAVRAPENEEFLVEILRPRANTGPENK